MGTKTHKIKQINQYTTKYSVEYQTSQTLIAKHANNISKLINYISQNITKWAYLCTNLNQQTTQNITFDSDANPLILDTGASCGFTHSKKDFITYKSLKGQIKGLGTLKIKGMGTVSYRLQNSDDQTTDLIIAQVFYVPSFPMRLLSPQQIAKQSRDPNAGLLVRHDKCTLTWYYHSKIVPYHDTSQLHILYTCPGFNNAHAYLASFAHVCQTRNQIQTEDDKTLYLPQSNLSASTKLLKLWHERLGHMNFPQIQTLAKQGYLPKEISKCDIPLCASCQYGKAHKRSITQNTTGILGGPSITKPGQLIHMDQIESTTPGRPLTYSGKNSKHKIYIVTLFVDHISKKFFVEFQLTTNVKETIESKQCMEAEANKTFTKIASFHADNGVFKANDFMKHLQTLGQDITFCGVGAHHQNGVSERSIRTIV